MRDVLKSRRWGFLRADVGPLLYFRRTIHDGPAGRVVGLACRLARRFGRWLF